MKSAVLSLPQVSVVSVLCVLVITLCLLLPAPQARAAALTQDQLSNVQSLLSSYGIGQDKINIVSKVLMADVPATAASSTPRCPVPGHALGRGATGDDVKALQERLNQDGLLSQDNVSGFFGSTTEAAVRQWQAQNGVVASGTPATTGFGAVGNKTLQALANCGRPTENAIEHMQNASSTPGMPPRPGHPNFPGGSGTPVPQAGSDQSGAAAMAQFAADYSQAFNDNLAAVVSAPFNFYVPILSDYFSALGVE